MNNCINVVALDDHPVFLETFAHYLSALPNIRSVTTCYCETDLFRHLSLKIYDVVFLDLNINNLQRNGFSICKRIREKYETIPIAILTQYENPTLVKEAILCKANAYLLKSGELDLVVDFLESTLDRKSDFQFSLRGISTIDNKFQCSELDLRGILTPQENQIMKLIINGLGKDEILCNLKIGKETYKTHHRNLLNKLNLSDDAALIRFAYKNQLL